MHPTPPENFEPLALRAAAGAMAWAAQAWSVDLGDAEAVEKANNDLRTLLQTEHAGERLFMTLEAGAALAAHARSDADSGLGGQAQLERIAALSAALGPLKGGAMVLLLGWEDGLEWVADWTGARRGADIVKKTGLLAPSSSEECLFAFLHSLAAHGPAREREAGRMGREIANGLQTSGGAALWPFWVQLSSVDSASLSHLSPAAAALAEAIAAPFRFEAAACALHAARSGRMGLALAIHGRLPPAVSLQFRQEQAEALGGDMERFGRMAGWAPLDDAPTLRAKAEAFHSKRPRAFNGCALHEKADQGEASLTGLLVDLMASVDSPERCLAMLAAPAEVHDALERRRGAGWALAWMEGSLARAAASDFAPASKDPLALEGQEALGAALSFLAARDIASELPPAPGARFLAGPKRSL